MCEPQFEHHMDDKREKAEWTVWMCRVDVRETLDTGFTDTNEPMSQDNCGAQKR